ncbi:MAG TPA: hypothetical protein VHM64_19800, partial [Candidatus Binatia bacterium]|nr:hypothetical protein [Candidatus Binatia bacterium]
LNQMDATPSLASETNREALLTLTGVPCLGELPYTKEPKAGLAGFGESLDPAFLNTLVSRRS